MVLQPAMNAIASMAATIFKYMTDSSEERPLDDFTVR